MLYSRFSSTCTIPSSSWIWILKEEKTSSHRAAPLALRISYRQLLSFLSSNKALSRPITPVKESIFTEATTTETKPKVALSLTLFHPLLLQYSLVHQVLLTQTHLFLVRLELGQLFLYSILFSFSKFLSSSVGYVKSWFSGSNMC